MKKVEHERKWNMKVEHEEESEKYEEKPNVSHIHTIPICTACSRLSRTNDDRDGDGRKGAVGGRDDGNQRTDDVHQTAEHLRHGTAQFIVDHFDVSGEPVQNSGGRTTQKK